MERLRAIETSLSGSVTFGDDTIRTNGDINVVAFGQYQGTAVVAKLPRRVGFEEGTVRVEAGVLECLASKPTFAKQIGNIAVPRLVNYSTEHVAGGPFSMATYVGGDVLSTEQMRQLTRGEQDLLGQKLGAFIVGVAENVDEPTYRGILDSSDPGHFDLLDVLCARACRGHELAGRGFPSLAAASEDLLRETMRYAQSGQLKPTIIGHDDLHEGNLTFNKAQGAWQLQGIFDFGGTKPSTPERELRHMQMIGCHEAVLAAIQTYEAHTGVELDEELIDFWAKVRLIISSTGQLLRGRFGTKEPYLLDILPTYFPEHDWSELHQLRQ